MTTATEPNPNTPRKPPLRSLAATQQQAAQRLAVLSRAAESVEATADAVRTFARGAEQAVQAATAAPASSYTEFLEKRLDAVAAATPAPAPGVRRVTARELESSLEAFFNKQVRSMGGIPVKLAPTQKGVPDRLVLLPGARIALVELKTSTGRLSSAQQLWHYRASELGTQVAVLAGRADILAWMRAQFPKDIPSREARALAAAANPRKPKSTTAAQA